jgi:hypothetical protein
VKKQPLFLLLALQCLGQSAVQDKGAPTPTISITITTPATEFMVRSPVPLKLVLRNTSSDGVGVRSGYVGPAYKGEKFRNIDIQVLDSSGKPVDESDLGRAIHGRDPKIGWGEPVRRPLAAGIGRGDSLTEQSDLSKEFDLSRPGRYTVQARRWDNETGQMVLSNKIAITITN